MVPEDLLSFYRLVGLLSQNGLSVHMAVHHRAGSNSKIT